MLALAIGAALFAIATVTGAFERKQQSALLTEPVVPGSIEEIVLANGVLEPVRMVSVGAQVSGQLKILHVDLGQAIEAGDLIAEIDSTPQSNALRIAEASLANIRAQLKARSVQLRQAGQTYERQRGLSRQRAVAAADLETAETAFHALEAEVEALEAQIAQATVEVENARTNLEYTEIRAPMDGVVVAIVTRAGQTLNASQAVPTIVVLAKLDVMKVKVQISEADIARVQVGQNVRFTIMGDARMPIAGTLAQIEPAPTSIVTEATSGGTATTTQTTANPAVYYNGLFETPNRDGRLRPMMTAVVTIVVGSARDVPLVAWSALREHQADGRYRVQVRSPSGQLSDRLVTIGLTDRIRAQVIDGLVVGDDVVIPADGGETGSGDGATM